MDDYRAIEIRDCVENENIYGIIMLNYKHKSSDFQNAIYEIKKKYIDKDLFVEDILEDELLDKFDWYELCWDEESVEI